ncbi:MAG: DEAD/DEAH box helicase [Anaerolineae bacterium]
MGDNVALALEALRASPGFMRQVSAWRTLPPREARLADFPEDLSPSVRQALQRRGVTELYAHQASALDQVRRGHDIVVATPTASGKSLVYLVPTLNALAADPLASALCLFPTKALARDQLATLNAYAQEAGLEPLACPYDGDTSSSKRSQARSSARVIVTNPDMLHAGILPRHPRWQRFFAGLRYVVLDEAHQYRGVFGSHVANVVRRLLRVCAFYGSHPQIICCSATVGNPRQLAETLIGREVYPVLDDGAPAAERTLILVNPPMTNRDLGVREHPSRAAMPIVRELLRQDAQTIVFVRSRLEAELITAQLRERMADVCKPEAIRGYRSGYRSSERRRIERGLAEGDVRCVVATSALELGVDIGGISAAVLIGYPGSIASTWQRAGRAGRRRGASAVFVIAGDSPVDQYVISHPEFLLERSPERALLNPDNLPVLLGHIGCAAYELPLATKETFGGEDLPAILSFLEERGRCRRSARGWLWVGSDYPAAEIGLRSSGSEQIALVDAQSSGPSVVGTLDGLGADLLAHPGAVYWHDGQQYLADEDGARDGRIAIRRSDLPYYTRAFSDTRVEVERVWSERRVGATCVVEGAVRVTTQVTGFRRIALSSGEVLDRQALEMPERVLDTHAAWLVFDADLLDELAAKDLYRAPVASRGANWAEQRDRARARDGYRCRLCGAPERDGRQHHVHHLEPFRSFQGLPEPSQREAEANALSNLVTLCEACHARVERTMVTKGTLAGLAYALSHLLPVHLMCDAHDLGTHTDVQGAETGGATIMVYDRAAGGIGLSATAAALLPELLEDVADHVSRCPCAAGCPACIGADAAEDARAKERVVALSTAIVHGV